MILKVILNNCPRTKKRSGCYRWHQSRLTIESYASGWKSPEQSPSRTKILD